MSAPTVPRTTMVHVDTRKVGRRVGYLIAIIVNLVLLWLVNVTPGWQDVPWITYAAGQVVWLVNLSLIAGACANMLYLVFDAWWFKALGELTLALISLVVSVRVLEVFPFDFSAYPFPWELLTRFILVIAIVGSFISAITQVVRLVRGAPSARTG